MRKHFKIIVGLILSVMIMFAFAGCGGSNAATPAEEATAALDTTLTAVQSADLSALSAIGGEESLKNTVEELGSEENTQSILQSMFGHFNYTIGTAEQIDDSHVNIPVTVSNVNMSKVVDTWIADLMAYAASDPDIASDKDALRSKTIEVLSSSVEKIAAEENGTVSEDVVFPMVLKNDKWMIDNTVDDSVLDAMLGGFVNAIGKLQGSGQ